MHTILSFAGKLLAQEEDGTTVTLYLFVEDDGTLKALPEDQFKERTAEKSI